MADDWARQALYYRNEFRQAGGLLIGLVTGLVADAVLTDDEIRFLQEWIEVHDEVKYGWPGDIIHRRLHAVLEDGLISEAEREHLLTTLRELIGGNQETLAAATHVTGLAFDPVDEVVFQGCVFCLTGNFVYAPREICESEVVKRGGIVKSSVSKRINYVIVGSLGSQEWKHGSYGTKIEKAIQLRRDGAPLKVVREDVWTAALDGAVVYV
jgi:NAD-dependent DNA ligase